MSRTKMSRTKVRKRRCAALALAAAATTPLVARAANTDVYVGASGSNWNNTTDWVISGTVTNNGNRINWDNGTFWAR